MKKLFELIDGPLKKINKDRNEVWSSNKYLHKSKLKESFNSSKTKKVKYENGTHYITL